MKCPLFLVVVLLLTSILCFAPIAPAVASDPIQYPSHEEGYYWVNHKGADIRVYGVRNPNGSITWNPGSERNARPRERRSAPVELPNERPPVAIPVFKPTPFAAPTPAATPVIVPEKSPDWVTNGVDHGRSVKAKDTYTAHTPEAARFVVEATTDAEEPVAKLHVTVIGNQDERARVLNDINTNPAFDSIRNDLWVQDYDTGAWPVDPNLGFSGGAPAIIVQTAKGADDPEGGRVIFRTTDYEIGAEGLAEAIRTKNPKYNSDKDPMPHKKPSPAVPNPTPPIPSPIPSITISESEIPYVVAGIGILLLLVFLPKKGD